MFLEHKLNLEITWVELWKKNQKKPLAFPLEWNCHMQHEYITWTQGIIKHATNYI